MSDSSELIRTYRHGRTIKISFIIACLILLFAVIGISLTIGQGISFTESYELIFNHITGVTYPDRSEMWWKDYFIWNNVMPRVIIGIFAGAGLAIGGAMMQSLMSNPLADPYTTGISSGACFGAVAAIVAGVSFTSIFGSYGIVGNAFLGALVPALIVILVSRRLGSSPAALILVGTAIAYFFNSFVTLMMITAEADDLQAAFLWQVGTLTGMTWSDIPLMLVITCAGSLVIMLLSKQLNLLTLGETSAKSLGLNVGQFRMICLVLLSVMTAAVISYTGVLGFIGLVSPHVVRLVIGSDNRLVMPASIAAGALFLVSCDLVSRVISNISDIPVGVVLSFIGSPIFLYLIIRKKNGSAEVY
ncbi:MAG: iron ABC transporter permease [Candidatus Methanoplasma sp.]|jgi:iron complex transport system permease protein|nr:iron ABC transporter permease [Candidatus Methanoplasma sp.]